MDINKEAHDRADKVHPKPRHDPVEYGLRGMAGAGAVLILFGGFSGIDIEELGIPLLFTVAICFCCPYYYYRDQENKYLARYRKELDKIESRKNHN